MEWGADDPVVADQTAGGSSSVADLVNPYVPAAVPAAAAPTAAPSGGKPFVYDPNDPGPVSTDGVPLLPLLRRLEGSGDDATSPAGAVGRYQIMPATAAGYGFDPTRLKDPAYNEMVATRIAEDLNTKTGGDLDATLVQYNASPKVFRRWLAAGRDDSVLPGETQKYLAHARELVGSAQPQPQGASWGASDPEAYSGFGANDAPAGEAAWGAHDPPAQTGDHPYLASAVGGLISGLGKTVAALSESSEAATTAIGNALVSAGVPRDIVFEAQPSGTPLVQRVGEAIQRGDIAPAKRNAVQSILHGAGEFAPGLGASMLDPVAGAGIFGAQGYAQAADEAKAKGASPEVAARAGAENAAVQAGVSMIPFAKPLEPLVGALAHPVAAVLAKVGVHSAADAAMMGTMQAGSNVVAEQNYDPNRPLTQGVGEAALTGALAGGVLHGGREAFNAATGRLRPAESAPGPSGEAPPAPMPATDAIEKYIGERSETSAPRSETEFPSSSAAAVESAQPSEFTGGPRSETPLPPPTAADIGIPISEEVQSVAADVPAPVLAAAAADIDEHRAAAPKGYSLFSAIKDLGGMRVKEPDGSATAGPDVQGALEDVTRKPPGMINNKDGMSPEQMQEALAARGWLSGDDGEAFVSALRQEGSGEKVFHPDSETPALHARRDVLDHEMVQAGVHPDDDPALAAAKLGAWRYDEAQGSSLEMETLRGRADMLGVPHEPSTPYSTLLSDVVEREAIQGDASHGGFDAHEREIEGQLTEADFERLYALAAEGPAHEHGEGAPAFPLPEGRQPESGIEGADNRPGEGAGSSGAGAPEAAGEGTPLSFGAADPVIKEAPKFARDAEAKAERSAPRMHPNVRTTPVGDTANPTERALLSKVEKAIAKIAPFAEVHPFRSISERVGDENVQAMGMAYRDRLRHIIAYALDAGDSLRVGRHEAVHALKSAGVIRPAEWDALAQAAVSEGWLERYRIPERYADLSDEAQIEEAVAEHFSSWRQHEIKGAPSFVNDAFTHVQRFLAHVADLARRAFGGAVTAGDVLSRMERGTVGGRPLGVDSPTGRVLFSRDREELADLTARARSLRNARNKASSQEAWDRAHAELLPISARLEKLTGSPLGLDNPEVAAAFGSAERFSPDTALIKAAVDEFGVTTNPGAAGYVLPDGRMLDFSEEGGGGGRTQDHRAVGGLDGIENSGADAMAEFMNKTGAARVDFSSGLFESQRPPTLAMVRTAVRAARSQGTPLLLEAARPDGSSRASVELERPTVEAVDQFFKASQLGEQPRFARKPIDEETHGPAGVINRILGPGAEAVGRQLVRTADRAIPDPAVELIDQVKMGLSPMGMGTERAQASAKDFANALRQSAHQWGTLDQWLQKTFTPEQQQRMWVAADEEGVLRRRGEEPGPGQGLQRLSPQEADAVRAMQARADAAFKRAQDMGMVKGDGLESYVPRMIVEMTAAGPKIVSRATPKQAKRGANLSTTTGQLRQRKYETTEETEAAAQAAFGEGAQVVRNIRTLALATQRLEQAVAGRTLVDKIKAMSKDAGGGELVAEGANPDPANYFTVEGHPALQQWRPKMIEEKETGKWAPALDQNGDLVFEASPLWVSREFEGPLKAVLSAPSTGVVRALMDLKAKMMGVIMYSPLMHNAVIWGKAIPADPRGVLTLQAYRRGGLARKDPGTMQEAIGAGMDPIGHRYFNQDITGIAAAEGQDLVPGRSWTSQVLSFIPGLLDRNAGEAVKRAVDKFGDTWHNTFLWDRIADLQAGLYVHIRDGLLAKGVDPTSAQRTAAHFANRYAGALPMESMSKLARTTANLALFSRSFTLGNMAAYKDIVMGLPSDVRAQILRDGGQKALEGVQGVARQKAVGMLVLDVALQYAGLTLAAGAVSWLTKEAFQAPWQNELGKENRFLIGYQPDGTAIYGRLPTGKVAEDLVDWATDPRDTLLRKLSPYGRLMYEMASNDRGYGQKLYDPFDHSPIGLAKNVGRVIWAFMGDMAPIGQLEGAQAALVGGQDRKTATLQALAPFTGLTISKGAPGGPAQADIYAARDEQQFKFNEARASIVQQIKAGDIAGARQRMTALGVPPGLQGYEVRVALNPKIRMSRRAIQDFLIGASPDQKARFMADRAAQADRAQSPAP